MSSQLSAHAITAHTAMTRISVSRCSTLPAHRGSASAEKCSTSFSTDIAILPSSMKGEPAARQSVRTCQTFSCVAPVVGSRTRKHQPRATASFGGAGPDQQAHEQPEIVPRAMDRITLVDVESMQTRGGWLPVELGFGLTGRGWAGAET